MEHIQCRLLRLIITKNTEILDYLISRVHPHHRLRRPVEAVAAEKLVMVLAYRSHQRSMGTHRVTPDAGK